jgi:membrane-bound lytic murein transglycosylase D
LPATELVDVEVLSITGKYNSLIIAKNIMMDIALFNHYNPAFDATMSTTGNFDLRLPADKMQLFNANKYQILNESVQVLLGDATIPDFKTAYPPPAKKKRQ